MKLGRWAHTLGMQGHSFQRGKDPSQASLFHSYERERETPSEVIRHSWLQGQQGRESKALGSKELPAMGVSTNLLRGKMREQVPKFAPTYSRDPSALTYLLDPFMPVCPSSSTPGSQLLLERIPESCGTLGPWELLRDKEPFLLTLTAFPGILYPCANKLVSVLETRRWIRFQQTLAGSGGLGWGRG